MEAIVSNPKRKLEILAEATKGKFDRYVRLKSSDANFHWSDIRHGQTGDTALHLAAQFNHADLMRYLLTSYHPPGVDCTNNDDKTALHDASQFAHYERVRQLLEHGAEVNALKRSDWTPLMLACTKTSSDSPKIVRVLLEHRALVDYGNKDGWTALHLACREGSLEIVKDLLDYGADASARTKNARSVLHIAALHGNLDVLVHLLSLGMDLDVGDGCGNTPLHEAVLGDHIDVCRVLVKHGASSKARNRTDYTVLHLAASQSSVQTVEFVLDELDVDVDEATASGLTALHCAARKGRRDVYEYLVKRGADLQLRDDFGRTAANYLSL